MGIRVKVFGFTAGKFAYYGQGRKAAMRKNGDIFEIDSMEEFSPKHMILLDEKKPAPVEHRKRSKAHEEAPSVVEESL